MDRPCADPARVAEKCNDMLPAFCCIFSLESLEVALWCASRNGICLDFQSQCWMWICGDLVEHQSHSTRGSRRKICDGHGWGRQICQHAKHIKALNGQFVLMFLFVHITHHNLLVSSCPPRNGSTIRGLVGFGWQPAMGTSVWQVVSGPSMQTSVLGQNTACRSIPKLRFNSLAQLKPNKIHKSQEPRATVRRIVALTAGIMRQGSRTLAGTCARRMLKNPGGGESSGCMWKRALAPRGQHNARGANRPCPLRFSIE